MKRVNRKKMRQVWVSNAHGFNSRCIKLCHSSPPDELSHNRSRRQTIMSVDTSLFIDTKLQWVTLINESWVLLPAVRYWTPEFFSQNTTPPPRLSSRQSFLETNLWPRIQAKGARYLNKAFVLDISRNSTSYTNTSRNFWGHQYDKIS